MGNDSTGIFYHAKAPACASLACARRAGKHADRQRKPKKRGV